MAITTLPGLREHLQSALEVEHTQIPAYLCALYSIREGCNREAARIIESVFVEEMLHMLLLANILNAVGGAPRLDHPAMLARYPAYLPHSNRAFQVPLAPFSRELIEIFMRVERPEDKAAAPQDERFETLGQFYEALVRGLKTLCAQLGEAQVFSGDPSRQITDAYYYGGSGRIITVTDLASALAALEEITEQGEGLNHNAVWDGDRNMFHPERGEVAHYFRFQQIVAGRFFRPGDTPQSGPTGETLAVDWNAVHPMRLNPRAADYPEGSPIRARLDEFNRTYAGVLHLLEQGLNGKPRLLAVATGTMYELKRQAIELMRLPSGDGKTTVGPAFAYIPPAQRHATAHIERKIVVWPNGPYVVYGDVPLVRKYRVLNEHGEGLTWKKGEPYETEETYALCRCGQSSAKPFCDGTHARVRFDGTESADPRPSAARQVALGGTGLAIKRDAPLCMGAHFCVSHGENIKQLGAATGEAQIRLMVIKMIENCPSGSYLYAFEPGGPDMEPDLPPAIAVMDEGPHAGCLWVTGNIPIERADGQPFETRNRVTLCRCGQSKNKPLCDGTHRKVGFKD